MKNIIKNYLFGIKPKNNTPSIFEKNITIKTIYPDDINVSSDPKTNMIQFNNWAQQLRVSQLYQR